MDWIIGIQRAIDYKWYINMLELEMQICNIDKYKNISFFYHLIFKK